MESLLIDLQRFVQNRVLDPQFQSSTLCGKYLLVGASVHPTLINSHGFLSLTST
jgi:hypothetical protein